MNILQLTMEFENFMIKKDCKSSIDKVDDESKKILGTTYKWNSTQLAWESFLHAYKIMNEIKIKIVF